VIRRSTFSLLLIICLGHVLLISAQVQSKSGLPLLQTVAFGTFSRFQGATGGMLDGVVNTWRHYFALRNAARESDTLKARIVELEAAVQAQQAIADRSHALEDALNLKRSMASPTIAARVIAGNPSPGSYTVTIDSGSAEGVSPDMAVISGRGVVGRVIQPVAPHAATVQLLTDRLAAVAVTFERTGTGGVVVGGAGDPPFRAEYVSVLADIQAGDKVISSGQDGIYPQGFALGTVERVTKSGGEDREIVIRPAVDFSHVDLVLVVVKPAKPAGEAP